VRFLLDTNAVIALLKGEAGFVARLRRYEPGDFGLSSIVLHELYYGAYKSQRVGANLARIEALRFEIVAFDEQDARRAGEVRAALAAAGTPIGPYDVLIGAQALARGLTLVTRNFGEFARVAGLRVEDWEGAE
jgi:tRNA(fMet)-specific endonuclease VapC